MLHAKNFVVDDEIAVVGSSNMNPRAFTLGFELMLLAVGGDLVNAIREAEDGYRRVSRELTLEQWRTESWWRRYLDKTLRLTSNLQ